jgi:general secretion pathway protein A
VAVRFRLPRLRPKETRAYVQHRLCRAGSEGRDLFTPGALQLVHHFSGGVPRLINVLCDRALLAMYSRRLGRVRRSTIRLAWRSLYPSWDPVRSAVCPRMSLRTVACAVGLALALAGAMAIGMWPLP